MRAVLLGALWALPCCTPEHGGPRPQLIRVDSAGVEVITNLSDPTSLPHHTLQGEPRLVIATDDAGDVVLDRISGVTPLRDGGIAVASRGAKTVYLFDSLGAYRTSFGREGEGPGEFRSIWGAFSIAPDSIAVWDNWLGRITIFGADGGVGRTVDLMRFLPPGAGGAVHPLGGDFALAGMASVGGRRAPGVYRDSAASFLLSAEGDSIGYYGRFPGAEVAYRGPVFGSLPFGVRLSTAALFDRLLFGTGDRPELMEYGPAARLTRLIRWPDHDRSLLSAPVDEFVEFQLASMTETERRDFATTLRSVPFPQTVPAYDGIVVSSGGTIWVSEFAGPGGYITAPQRYARTWLLIDGSEGALLRRISGPLGFELLAVQEDRAYGVHRDELGVETVRVYEVPASAR